MNNFSMSTPDVFDVANYILEVSREESEDDEYELISHMKLQKLVYFCQGFSLALYGEPLFQETIEAWKHGPVCPKLYHLLKGYGSSPVPATINPGKISLDEQQKHLIRMVYGFYGQYSASRLRKITHDNGPWKDTSLATAISREAMSRYFESLIEANPADVPPTSEEEKEKILRIVEEAEANGEIDLSQFCVPMGA